MTRPETTTALPASSIRTRAVYVVRLSPEAGMTEDQATRGLRALLKTALRLHGFRCLSAEPELTDEARTAEVTS